MVFFMTKPVHEVYYIMFNIKVQCKSANMSAQSFVLSHKTITIYPNQTKSINKSSHAMGQFVLNLFCKTYCIKSIQSPVLMNK